MPRSRCVVLSCRLTEFDTAKFLTLRCGDNRMERMEDDAIGFVYLQRQGWVAATLRKVTKCDRGWTTFVSRLCGRKTGGVGGGGSRESVRAAERGRAAPAPEGATRAPALLGAHRSPRRARHRGWRCTSSAGGRCCGRARGRRGRRARA